MNYNQCRRTFKLFVFLAGSRTPKSLKEIVSGMEPYGFYADDRGMNPRTIQRDIRFMREHMELKVLNIPGKGYVLDTGANPLLSVALDPEELHALCFASALMVPFKGTHLERALERLCEKLTGIFNRCSKLPPVFPGAADAAEVIFQGINMPGRRVRISDSVLRTSIQAVQAGRKVAFTFANVSFTALPIKILTAPGGLHLLCDRSGTGITGITGGTDEPGAPTGNTLTGNNSPQKFDMSQISDMRLINPVAASDQADIHVQPPVDCIH